MRGLLLTVALALASSIAAAAGPELEVEAPAELARQAAAIRALAALDHSEALRMVGLPDPGPPLRVVLAAEGSPLAVRVPSWVSGYALPPLGVVVLFPARVPSYPDRNLEALLRHEIAHVLVYRAAGGRRLPRWFEEGAATVAAREWGIEDRARVTLATLGRRPRSLREVEEAFAGDGGQAARAYAMSAALVRSLRSRHGPDALARVLAHAAGGADFLDAFSEATGETLGRFERAFFGRQALWGTWVPFLTSTTALWMAITLLALLAARRRRARDAELRARWHDEDHGPLMRVPSIVADDRSEGELGETEPPAGDEEGRRSVDGDEDAGDANPRRWN